MRNRIYILLMIMILTVLLIGCEEQKVLEANMGNIDNEFTRVDEVREEELDGTITVGGEISVEDQLQKLVDQRPDRLKMYEYIKLEDIEQKKANGESFLVAWTSELCEACELYKPVVFQYVNNSPRYQMYYVEVSAAYPEGKEYFDNLEYEGTPTTEFYVGGELKSGESGLMDLTMLEEFIVNNIR